MRLIFIAIVISILLAVTGCGKPDDKYIASISERECAHMIKRSVLAGEFFDRRETIANSETVFIDGYELRLTDHCREMIRTYY